MADVEITYNNDEVASLNDSGSVVLETDGTLMADDVTISYTKSAAPVTSVNGKTGAVILTASDVGAVTSDVNVTQTATTTSGYTSWRPIMIGNTSASAESGAFSTTTGVIRAFDNLRVQPSSGTIKATTFKGNLTGNVTGDVTGTASGNYSASNPPPYPVTSVNGSTGAITVEPTIKAGSVTLATASWTGNGPYTQTVTVTGVTVTANSKVDIQPDATAIQQMITDECAAIYIDNNNGTLTAYAVGNIPTADLTVQVTVMEVS